MNDLEMIETAVRGEWTAVGYLNAILAVLRVMAELQGVEPQKLLDIINEAANNP